MLPQKYAGIVSESFQKWSQQLQSMRMDLYSYCSWQQTFLFCNQLFNASEASTTYRTFSNNAKPTFNLVDPRCISRRKMNMEPFSFSQPCPCLGMFMCAVVIHNEMNIKFIRN